MQDKHTRFSGKALPVICFCTIALLAALLACSQTQTLSSPRPGAEDPARLGHHEITVAALPPPYATPSATDPPAVVPPPLRAELHLPPGFEISTFAEGFHLARWMVQAPNGDVFVSDAEAGTIVVLRDARGEGKATERFTFATGLTQPFGLAFWRDYLYVGNTDSVVRFHYKLGQTQAEGAPERICALPGFGYLQHWTRNVIFSPDGSKMYVTVGAQTNVGVEKEPMRAAISEYNPDGSGHRLFATGTRNPVGLAFNPSTGKLWTTVNERDGLGDDLPPDYVTEVKEGGFYGWPYAYIGAHEDPRHKGERPDLEQKALVPDVLIQAHSAALGLVFYEGRMFPPEYRGDAFVALHGSWNRSRRTGYKIIRIRMKNGRPAGGYDDFVTGWMLAEDSREVWGRPVGLLVLKDGSLLIADDGGKKIWRATYRAPGRSNTKGSQK